MSGKIDVKSRPLRAGSLLGCLLLATALPTLAEEAEDYIEVLPGTLPVILTAPHGGDQKPASILARRYGVVAQDQHTAELTRMIVEEMEELYGGRPHAVICRLHRSKLDCNRELDEAAQGDAVAMAAWTRFHAAAAKMGEQIRETHGAGLTLDIHGHRHEAARVELGYLVKGTQLNVSNEVLNATPELWKQSSVRELDQRSPQSWAELIRGPQSLGALLERHGFNSVPSPQQPQPGQEAYYSGAYGIAAHGSREGGTISAIQVECPWRGVRDERQNRRRFAKALALSLGEYFRAHFGMTLGQSRASEASSR